MDALSIISISILVALSLRASYLLHKLQDEIEVKRLRKDEARLL